MIAIFLGKVYKITKINTIKMAVENRVEEQKITEYVPKAPGLSKFLEERLGTGNLEVECLASGGNWAVYNVRDKRTGRALGRVRYYEDEPITNDGYDSYAYHIIASIRRIPDENGVLHFRLRPITLIYSCERIGDKVRERRMDKHPKIPLV